MNKDKLICKDISSHNINSHASTIGHSGSNCIDGACSIAYPVMGSYRESQPIGAGMASYQGYQNPSRELGGAYGGLGSSYGGCTSIGITGGNSSDGIGNKSHPRTNQSETEMMHFARIIRLYYMVMYHTPLYSCLKLLYAHLNPNNPNKIISDKILYIYLVFP